MDPTKGKIYVVDYGVNAKILVAGLDGTELRPLIQSKIAWPAGRLLLQFRLDGKC